MEDNVSWLPLSNDRFCIWKHPLNYICVTEALNRPQKPPNMVLYQGKFSQPYSCLSAGLDAEPSTIPCAPGSDALPGLWEAVLKFRAQSRLITQFKIGSGFKVKSNCVAVSSSCSHKIVVLGCVAGIMMFDGAQKEHTLTLILFFLSESWSMETIIILRRFIGSSYKLRVSSLKQCSLQETV